MVWGSSGEMGKERRRGSPCVRECLGCVELRAGDERVESLDGSQGKGRLVGEKTSMLSRASGTEHKKFCVPWKKGWAAQENCRTIVKLHRVRIRLKPR